MTYSNFDYEDQCHALAKQTLALQMASYKAEEIARDTTDEFDVDAYVRALQAYKSYLYLLDEKVTNEVCLNTRGFHCVKSASIYNTGNCGVILTSDYGLRKSFTDMTWLNFRYKF